MADFDLRSDGLRVLECAARLWDEIGAMEAELKDSPKLVPGSRGQLTANPLLSEVRAHRRELRGQLLQLGLSEDDGAAAAGNARSAAGRALVRQRWSQTGRGQLRLAE